MGIARKKFFTKRLVLRPYSRSDYNTWFDYYVNRSRKRSKYDRGPMEPEICRRSDFNRLCKRHEKLAAQDKVYIYGGFDRKTGQLVGIVDIGVLVRENYQLANLGYQVHNHYWGLGYGKELALAGAMIAFKQLGLHCVEAAINVDNKRSLALARSIKMKCEGIRRRYLFENGKWTDNYVFTFTAEDFGAKVTRRPSISS